MVKKITCEVQWVDGRADGTAKHELPISVPGYIGVILPSCGRWLGDIPLFGVAKELCGQCQDQLTERSVEEHAAKNFSVEELDKMQELCELERRMGHISFVKN